MEINEEDDTVKEALLRRDFGALLVDPPRAGLDATTLSLAQSFPHVLSIACNPDALRMNVEGLRHTHEIKTMVALDMFPYTGHMELLVHMERMII